MSQSITQLLYRKQKMESNGKNSPGTGVLKKITRQIEKMQKVESDGQ